MLHRKMITKLLTLLVLSVLFLAGCNSTSASKQDGIKVGVLFSLSGETAITEEGMANGALLAIEEINENGGVNGKKLIPIKEDYASDPAQAATKANKLILQDEVVAIVGGLTSASRQAMLPIVEQNNSLLFYPTSFEGLEYSKNIIYTNAVPNQMLQEFFPWVTENLGKKVYFIGNDYVYPVETNNQVKEMLEMVGGEVVGERYVPMGETEFSTILNDIKQAQPDYIFSSLVAISTPAFYSQYSDYGFDPSVMPIVSLATSESEVAGMSNAAAVGHISSLPYFNNIDTPENKAFVEAFKEKYGEDQPITTYVESSYFSVYLLVEALSKIDDPYDTDALIDALIGIEFNAPQGKIKIDENNHTWLHSRIGKLNDNGEFEIIKTFEHPIQPEPWSNLLYPGHEEPWK